jgi:antitoxin HicB
MVMKTSSNPYIGSSFDSWLREEGIHRQVNAAAIRRVRAWQINQTAKEPQVTRATGVGPSQLRKKLRK